MYRTLLPGVPSVLRPIATSVGSFRRAAEARTSGVRDVEVAGAVNRQASRVGQGRAGRGTAITAHAESARPRNALYRRPRELPHAVVQTSVGDVDDARPDFHHAGWKAESAEPCRDLPVRIDDSDASVVAVRDVEVGAVTGETKHAPKLGGSRRSAIAGVTWHASTREGMKVTRGIDVANREVERVREVGDTAARRHRPS